MSEIVFKGKQRRFLRSLGVGMKPTVFIGKEGISDAVLSEINEQIQARELVKIRLLDNVDGARKELAAEVAAAAKVELIQVLGRTILLYRRNEEEPQIELPQ